MKMILAILDVTILVLGGVSLSSCSSTKTSYPLAVGNTVPPVFSPSQFIVKYKSGDSLAWSQDLGEATNGCVDLSGQTAGSVNPKMCTYSNDKRVIVEDSAAALLCRSLTNVSSGKARLPTREEYENLLKEFDHTMTSKGKPRLTKRGLDHFSSKIDDMLNDRNYTSSSVEVTENVDDSGAKVLEANAVYQLTLGQLSNYYWNRIIPARVRCVLDPLH